MQFLFHTDAKRGIFAFDEGSGEGVVANSGALQQSPLDVSQHSGSLSVVSPVLTDMSNIEKFTLP